MQGWIKLHRKLLGNPIVCKDSDHLAVWAYLLLQSSHKEHPAMFGKNKIMLQPGQLITGRIAIAEKLRVSESKVERILNAFESEQQIEQQKSNKNRLISIVSWSEYQDSEQQNEQEMNNKWTTSEQQVNTYKNDINSFTTTATTPAEPVTLDTIHTKVFGTMFMNGLMSEFVQKVKAKGYTDAFLVELMLETGESGTKPSLRLMETIADRWMREGIYTRADSKRMKDAARPSQQDKPSEREAKAQQRLAEERKKAEIIPLQPEFLAKEGKSTYDPTGTV